MNEFRPAGLSCCENVCGYDWMAFSRIRVHGLAPCPRMDAGGNLGVAIGDALRASLADPLISRRTAKITASLQFCAEKRPEETP